MAKPQMERLDVNQPSAPSNPWLRFPLCTFVTRLVTPAQNFLKTVQPRRGFLLHSALLTGVFVLQGMHASPSQAAQPTLTEAGSMPATSAGQVSASSTKAETEAASEQSIRANIAQTEQRLLNLRAKYTDEYPDVIEAREQLTELQGQLERVKARTGILTPVSPPAAASLPESMPAPDPAPTSSPIEAPKPGSHSGMFPATARKGNLKSVQAPVATRLANSSPVPLRAPLPETTQPLGDLQPKTKTTTIATPPAIPERQSSPLPGRTATQLTLILFIVSGAFLAIGVFLMYQRLLHKRRQLYISDVATLRSMLAQEFDYVGSIPRMRNG